MKKNLVLFFASSFCVHILTPKAVCAQDPKISYPKTAYQFPVGTSIPPLSPSNSGGAVSYGLVSTLAGNGNPTSIDGSGTTASFGGPQGIAVDKAGNVYVAEYGTNKIKKVTPAGFATTFAGNGITIGNNGIGTAASFNSPTGVVLNRTAISLWQNLAKAGSGKFRRKQ